MKNVLKNLGVFTVTGAMAIFGMVVGMVTFKPENITFKNNENNKESE